MEIETIWNDANTRYRIQQKEREYKPFLELLNKMPRKNNALEIGCYDCGTTYGLCKIFKAVISIDMNPQPTWYGHKIDNPNWSVLTGDSHSTRIVELIESTGIKFDLILIDGDHTADGSMEDFLIYKQFLAENGVIAFHDILETDYHKELNCNVHETWQALKEMYPDNTIEITDTSDLPDTRHFHPELDNKDWGGIGVIQYPVVVA